MKNRIPIETNHITYDNQKLFGMEYIQKQMINTLLFQTPNNVHNYVLNSIYKDGVDNVTFKLTRSNAEKLIKILIQIIEKEIDLSQYDLEIPFQFYEYDTPEWHEWKNKERQKKLIL